MAGGQTERKPRTMMAQLSPAPEAPAAGRDTGPKTGGARVKPKLLIVTTVPETLATILTGQPRFLTRDFDVALATSPLEEFSRVAWSEEVPVHAVAMNRGISPGADLLAIWRMVRLIRRVKPDIIHSYTPKAGLVAMIAGWLARVPVRIHTFTGLVFHHLTGPRHWLLKNADRMIAAAATHVVPEGAGVRRDLAAAAVTRKPLRVIGNGNIAGIDTRVFDPDAPGVRAAARALRARLGIRPEAFVFAYVGRFNRDKGLDELTRAFSSLPGDSSRLVLFGRHDPSAPPSADTLRAIEAHPRIHVAGFLDDIRPGLLMADAVVLPSYREGVPNVLIQGSAMGRPLLATDVNGSNEIVAEGETGLLVPAKDTAALARAMARLEAMPAAARAALGRAGRARVQALYEQADYREELVGYYRAALAGTAPG